MPWQELRQVPVETRCLLRLLGCCLPREDAERWCREWLGESWYWLRKQRPQLNYQRWVTRLQLFQHALGAVVDIWFLLTSGGLFRTKMVCFLYSSWVASALLTMAVVIVGIICSDGNALDSLNGVSDTVLIARRNPFLGKLESLSPAERQFLSHRHDVFAAFGIWATYQARPADSRSSLTVIQLDEASRTLFGLHLAKGVWPSDGHGCEVASASPSFTLNQVVVLGPLRCTVVGIVSRPMTPIPNFAFLLPASSSLPEVTANTVARIQTGISEDRCRRILDLPFDSHQLWLRSGRGLVFTPVKQIRTKPLQWGLSVFLTVWLVAVLCQPTRSLHARMLCLFETTLVFLLVSLPWLAGVERLAVTNSGTDGVLTALAYSYPLLTGSAVALGLFQFQRRCCRACHRRLVSPVVMGRYDSVLMEPAVRESLCPTGHGSLLVHTTPQPQAQWLTWSKTWG